MKAIVYTQYGAPKVLQLREVQKPSPKANEILVRIKATAVNSGDVRLRKADPFAVRLIFGLLKPRINTLGSVFSGEVESTGKLVKRFKVGDRVFGHTNMSFGAYAEYICVPEDSTVAIKPADLSDNEAAAIPFGAVTALHFIKKVRITPGQKVLIVGASGSVGSAAVQLAKSYGAIVTGVCGTSSVDLVKFVGADKVIDYTKEDFTKNGEIYDLIIDTVNTISVSRSLKSLTKNGVMILSAAGMPEMLQGLWISKTSKRRVLTGVISHSQADINFIKELIEAGKFKAVVDRIFPLDQMVEAHTYIEMGLKRGNIGISI
jgi:2-desacetyl-2-hydroxyethyl bacteriochlorophyllide A dehydrogenase